MKPGDYVAFYDGTGLVQIGRVAEIRNGKTAFVCFTNGCTAAACAVEKLAVVEPNEAMCATPFGFHRFDDRCPNYEASCCAAFCPGKERR